ncbi:hypothetical protein [Haloferula sp.]|uniref:hypothetical protein n=1 Tax=Haloferula sp. TaxID=2497595 RepID=UPI00329D149B
MSLRASWKRTQVHLNDARSELPKDPAPGSEAGSASGFQEFLEHNELELALDELEGMSTTNPTTTHFWFSLRAAASEMELERYRDRYSRVLDRNQPFIEYHHDAGNDRLQFGSEEIGGFPDTERRCDDCGQVRFYHDTCDAYFCAFCNRWLEAACSDPYCDYCKARPSFPLKTRANKTLVDDPLQRLC